MPKKSKLGVFQNREISTENGKYRDKVLKMRRWLFRNFAVRAVKNQPSLRPKNVDKF